MVERLVNFFESTGSFASSDTLLVGVSGGIDSVVLVDLLQKAGLAFAVAHCNFHLRGLESDLDEAFVRTLAERYEKPFFCQSFNTKEIAVERGISIEMAARDLRYGWFEDIRKSHHFDWIVVAHHRDDQVETFFLNLARGTGIAGLSGMNSIHGKVIRPLLFASRKEIVTYAAKNKLNYREDSSNLLTDFQRNKIRHLILPLMEELNPSFRESMQETILHLRETSIIYSQAIERVRELVVRPTKRGDIEISLAELRLYHPITTYLFELLKPYHFNGDVVQDIIQAMGSQPGKQFFSATHRAVLDRDVLFIHEVGQNGVKRYYLDEDCSEIVFPIKLAIGTQKRTASFVLNSSPKTALVDKDLIQFPLILRRWEKGDYFQPLGMTGLKKLSNFFVDEKFSLPEKERTWLLTNGEEIVWIVGVRLDNRYKVTPGTKNILVITLE